MDNTELSPPKEEDAEERLLRKLMHLVFAALALIVLTIGVK